MTAPTWGDDPTPVLGLIKALVEDPPQATATEPSAEAERRLLDHRLLRPPRRRAVVLRAIEAARIGAAFREDTHFHATRALPILRRLLLEAGRRLSEAGVLPQAEDVFHLHLEELEALPGPDQPGRRRRRSDPHDSAGSRGPAAPSWPAYPCSPPPAWWIRLPTRRTPWWPAFLRAAAGSPGRYG